MSSHYSRNGGKVNTNREVRKEAHDTTEEQKWQTVVEKTIETKFMNCELKDNSGKQDTLTKGV